MSDSSSIGCSSSLYGWWFVMFLVIKVGGHFFATWSWWWLFFPIVPDLVLILTKLGWMA